MKFSKLLILAGFGIALVFSACKKVQETNGSALSPSQSANPDALVSTPAGLIPRSHLHFIENGYALMRRGGHLYKVERASRKVVEDFGAARLANSAHAGARIFKKGSDIALPSTSVDLANSWITDAVAKNTSSNLITSFSANWVVPNVPSSNDNQLLYIFNGLAIDTFDVMQPALQWGDGPAGNTNGGWAIANWYVWFTGALDETEAAFTSLVPVSSGTVLQGTLTYTGQEGASAGAYQGSYDYTSTVTNVTTGQALNNPLNIIGDDVEGVNNADIPYIFAQNTVYATLEAWTNNIYTGPSGGVTQASDYPAGQNYVDMYNMVVNSNGTPMRMSWTAENRNTRFGENTLTTPWFNNSTNGGQEISLYWHPIPTINGQTFINPTSTSTSYTVAGYPGNTVNIAPYGSFVGRGGGITGVTTTTVTITTPGLTFSNGSTTVSATNGSAIFTTTMPASGSFTVNASYTTTGSFGFVLSNVKTF